MVVACRGWCHDVVASAFGVVGNMPVLGMGVGASTVRKQTRGTGGTMALRAKGSRQLGTRNAFMNIVGISLNP